MGKIKSRKTLADIYKGKTHGIYKENTVFLRFLVEKLPEDLKSRIGKFRSFLKAKKLANENISEVELIEDDSHLSFEIDNLIKSICTKTGLSKKHYEHHIAWYILYDKYKGPPVNFQITSTKNSVIIELFRLPKTDDWKIMKPLVSYEFDKMPNVYSARIDPRHENTFERRQKASQIKDGYDALDEIYGETEIKDKTEKKKLKLLHQDRKRREKLIEKTNIS